MHIKSNLISKSTALFYTILFLISSSGQTVEAATFSDVSEDNQYYTVVESLAASGVISGYEDGTFQPDKEVNRAEALKIILKSAGIQPGTGLFSTGFTDVQLYSWYAGYVMQALLSGIISGNPDGTFAGERTVNEAEYLKMTLNTYKIDLSKHQNLDYWIASDTAPGQWYTPYLSYAKTLGLVYPDLNNNLYPSKYLTRGQCAEIIYKLMLISQGGETQKMLSLAEAALVDAIIKIHNDDINGAILGAETALNYSNQALAGDPASSAVQSSNLICQAFQKLFQAYRSGLVSDSHEVIIQVTEAKTLATEAVEKNSSSAYFAGKVNEYGDNLLNQGGL